MVEKLAPLVKKNLLLIAFLVMGVVSWIASSDKKDESINEPSSADMRVPPSVDTYIPKGYTLVPIDIANAESLSSLIGDQGGVVDLYLATTEKQKGGLKVGERLKLLRAPLNPELYAVLVKATEGHRLLSHPGPFIAVVQNPEEKNSVLPAATAATQKVRVDYQN